MNAFTQLEQLFVAQNLQMSFQAFASVNTSWHTLAREAKLEHTNARKRKWSQLWLEVLECYML